MHSKLFGSASAVHAHSNLKEALRSPDDQFQETNEPARSSECLGQRDRRLNLDMNRDAVVNSHATRTSDPDSRVVPRTNDADDRVDVDNLALTGEVDDLCTRPKTSVFGNDLRRDAASGE